MYFLSEDGIAAKSIGHLASSFALPPPTRISTSAFNSNNERAGFYITLAIPNTGFKELDVSQGIEEELLPTYKAEKYFPAEIGQVLKDRYQIIGKLGYGGSSTVWLSRDLE
ncbi:hypothetical protein LOY97_006508 [Ophidiomyces ophidiicola]|nr:hypothetical protein LOZ49_006648 [Ophidiomyces ophidiicola]KAI2126857.1 hypothetical protein LOZ29_006817 [Ophidiomyces ophidiicola]KAI2207506.1 hypothetical protein LOZ15_006800 [Ophidiomyces ophidiicola]KAI2434679.1 hypothetical protein LOZ08_006627 [Ophidiomyces ophidiicola]KAI2450693.1 hypothetical protein LOY86_004590 [Ophidiomyces ophidiicola]